MLFDFIQMENRLYYMLFDLSHLTKKALKTVSDSHDLTRVAIEKRGNLILHYFTDWRHKKRNKNNNESSQMV